MINVVLLGPPGVGKGTQAKLLVNTFGLIHLSTGDLFRENIKRETSLGKMAKAYIDKGLLVPDEVTNKLLKTAVLKQIKAGAKGLIFDGYPRNTHQAYVLDNFLNEHNIPVSTVLAIEIDNQILIQRILKRGEISGRTDDQSESTIRDRISIYHKNTAMLKDFYTQQDKLFVINGLGTIEEIGEKIRDIVKKLGTHKN